MNKKFLVIGLTMLLLLAFTGYVFAQSAETGTISGTVTDPTGAVVSGAKVTVTSVATKAERTTTTDASGNYTVVGLPPAQYDVTIEGSGFAKQVARTSVTVGGHTGLDAKLKVSAAPGEVVEVNAAAEAVMPDTESQTLGDNVTAQQISEIPTQTRDPYSLVSLSGMVSSDANGATGRGVGFSINGQRAASTNILLDGGENVDNFTATVGQSVPQDSVQEFSVLTNDYSAEYGRASGGIVNVATKSGSNAFHGTAYEYYRGSGLASNTPENKAQGQAKPTFVRNQFGAAVGGPIIKDKLFFFGAVEWTRVRSSVITNYWIPTPGLIAYSNANTQAFFSTYGTIAATPTGQTLNTLQVQAAKNFTAGPNLSGYDAANPGAPVLEQVANSIPTDGGGGAPQNTIEPVARIDFNLSNNTTMFFRYGMQKNTLFPGWVSWSPYGGYNTGEQVQNQNFMWSVSHIFTPRLVSQTKLLFNRLNDLQPQGPLQPTLFWKSSGNSYIGEGMYLPGYLPCCYGSGIPFGGPQNVYQITEDLSWTKGNHNMKFGGEYVHMRDNRVFGAYGDASEVLGSNWSAAFENLIGGNISRIQTAIYPQGKTPCAFNYTTFTSIVTPSCTLTTPLTEPKFSRNNRFNDVAIYAQDSWKIIPRFTFNYGLRWEYYGVQHNADPSLDANYYYGSGSNFFEQYRNGGSMPTAGSPTHGLWAPQYHNFAPRVGFAWDIFGNGKTSLRGGYGISFERNFGNVTFNVIQNPPNYGVVSLTGTMPLETSNFGPLGGAIGSFPVPTLSVRHVSQNIKVAYSEMWSLAVDRELTHNTMLSLEYAGSRGIHLYSLEDLNRLGSGVIYNGDTPGLPCQTCTFGDSTYSRMNDSYGVGSFNRSNRGYSHYNAMNVKFRTDNFKNTGLTLTANYTYAHALDNLSSTFSDSSANYNTGLLDPYNPSLDYGNADFDVRHRAVISAIWTMPFFKNSDNKFLKYGLGGWELTPTFTVRSGLPYTLYNCYYGYYYCARAQMAGPANYTSAGSMVDANTYNIGNYPVLNVGCLPNTGNWSGGNPANPCVTDDYDPAGPYFNPITGLSEIGNCTFPGQGALGPCPWPSNMTRRNQFRGPAARFFDMGIFKNVKINERISTQFRAEFYNMFNHPNMYFDSGNLDVSAQSCTETSPTTANCVMTGKKYDNRQIQLGIRIIF